MSMSTFIKQDENGNWPTFNQGAVDQTTALKAFTFQTAATATGNGTVADVSGYSILTLNVLISATAGVTFEGSVDNSNFYPVIGQIAGSTGSSASSSTTSNIFRFNVSGIKYFRARISAYTSGTVDVSGNASKDTFTFNPTTGALGNADANLASYTSLITANYLLGYNGSTWDRIRTVNTGQLITSLYGTSGTSAGVSTYPNSDGVSGNVGALATGSYGLLYNGTTWDRARTTLIGDGAANTGIAASMGFLYNGTAYDRPRGNTQGTAYASAARTTAQTGSDQRSFNARGIIVYLNVTAASGTGGLTVAVQGKMADSAAYKQLHANVTAVTAIGTYSYIIYPGSDTTNTGHTQVSNSPIPHVWRINVSVGDSSSYTYSLTYDQIV